MRWRVLTALLIIGAILAGGAVCRIAVARTCDQVSDLLLQQKGRADEEMLESALRLWDESLPVLSILLHHQQLEAVGLSMARGLGALRAGDIAGCMAQIDASLYILSDIREYDDIQWKTLF